MHGSAEGSETSYQDYLDAAEHNLAKGNLTQTIQDAENAQALQPDSTRPLLVKALAYEALGHLETAAALLDAYREVLGEGSPDSRSTDARTRLEQAEKVAATTDNPRPELPLESLTSRVKDATASGRCAVAQATALEVRTMQPDQGDSYRLIGNAARCADDKRAAVLAYRRYQELGGDDPRVEMLVSNLSSSLAALTVQVVGVPEDAEPALHLELAGERIATEADEAGVPYFSDLTAATDMILHVGGRGIEPAQHPIVGLSPGERRSQDIEANWIGVVQVGLTRHDPTMAAVMLMSPEGAIPLTLEEPATVTAAELSAVVSNEFGSVTAELWPEGDTLRFDPMIWTPSQLTVVGLPAESAVRIFMEGAAGAFVEENYEVSDQGVLDEERGVVVAPPQKFDGLIGGNAGIFITHPVLGSGTAGAALEAGSVNATTYRWDTMPGVPGVQEAWDNWKTGERLFRQNTRTPAWLSLGIGIGSVLASGGLWAGAVAKGNEANSFRQDALNLVDGSASSSDPDALNNKSAQHQSALAAHQGLLAAAIASSSIGVAGVVLSFPLRSRAQRLIRSRPPWTMNLALKADSEDAQNASPGGNE